MLFNDLYCLDKDGVCTLGIGASQPHHFDEHLKVLPYLENGDRKIFSGIEARFKRKMVELTGHERPDHFWNEFPNWDETPGNVNIRMVLWLANIYQAWDIRSFARERYAGLNRGSSWVPGNNGKRAADLDFSEMKKPESMTADQLKEFLLQAHALLKQEKP